MHTFRVWAPLPKSVKVIVNGEAYPMEPVAQGWWSASVASAGPGSDYGFQLDRTGPLPDPCSPWQPEGVLGLSRVVDHLAFRWTDENFKPPPLARAVIYELHIGTFTLRGTFESAIEKLDHLVDLGVTHLELMPVNEFPGEHGWGYDGVNLFAPHHAYGGPQGLKRLVEASHARGLGVLLDVVYNHLGPTGNYLALFAPFFNACYRTPWGPALNFDGPHSDQVRRFFCDNALMWLREYHFDGLRLDAVHAIFDSSAVPFLEQLGVEVRKVAAQLGRPLVLIPESDLNDPRLLWPLERGGFELDAQWNDDFHHALHAALTGERSGYYQDFGTLAHLAKALRHAYVHDGRYSISRRRHHGRPPTGLTGQRFLAYLQNHDQIGNRAKGDRSSQLMSWGRLKVAAALVFTSPFVPLLFQGEEWGTSTPFLYFTDHLEPELANAVREGRQREFAAFGWKLNEIPDPQAPESFERSKLDWSEPMRSRNADLLEWHRQLIRLRRTLPALGDGPLESVNVRFDEAGRWLVVERGTISVVCNVGTQRQRVAIRAGKHQMVMASETGSEISDTDVNLPPDSVAILNS